MAKALPKVAWLARLRYPLPTEEDTRGAAGTVRSRADPARGACCPAGLQSACIGGAFATSSPPPAHAGCVV